MRKSLVLACVCAVIIIFIFTFILVSCQNTDAYGTKYYVKVDGHPEASFIYIPRHTSDYKILVYNEKTKVMYLASKNSDSSDPLTLIVDENGNPAVWEE